MKKACKQPMLASFHKKYKLLNVAKCVWLELMELNSDDTVLPSNLMYWIWQLRCATIFEGKKCLGV